MSNNFASLNDFKGSNVENAFTNFNRLPNKDNINKAEKGKPHAKHKYLKIDNGKYIYDQSKMAASDHRDAEKHHNEMVASGGGAKTGFGKEKASKYHKTLADQHRMLAEEKSEAGKKETKTVEKKFEDKVKGKEKKVDYSELEWKMDKFMPDDEDAQKEYYDIIDSNESDDVKLKNVLEFFDNNIDEESASKYMPKNGTLEDFAKYVLGIDKEVSKKNTIKKSFNILGIEDGDKIEKGAHSKHKYLKIDNGKYIYDDKQMTSENHYNASLHHSSKSDKSKNKENEKYHRDLALEHYDKFADKSKKEKESKNNEHQTEYDKFFDSQTGKGVAEIKANFMKHFGTLGTDENYKIQLNKYLDSNKKGKIQKSFNALEIDLIEKADPNKNYKHDVVHKDGTFIKTHPNQQAAYDHADKLNKKEGAENYTVRKNPNERD